METGIIIGGALWIGCGVLHAGFYYAYFQRKYPELADGCRRDDAFKACGFAILGPVALAATLICQFHKHGWLLPFLRPVEGA